MDTSSFIKWTLVAASFAVAGCTVIPEPQADPTRYYVLTGPGPDATRVQTHEGGLRIGLRAVQLAAYLDKGVMVVRRGTNELSYNDYARWGEPLADAITRMVQARLNTSPRVNRVFVHPFPFDQARDYDVALNVLNCEGVRDGDQGHGPRLRAHGNLHHGSQATVVARRMFTVPDRSWDGRDYEALARLLSEAIASLGDEVVAALPDK